MKQRTLYLYIVIIILLFFDTTLKAQPYVDGGNTRHRFAQLTLGSDYRFFSGNGTRASVLNTLGQLEHFELVPHSESRLIIGGTHFWGHADFYVAIPIASFGKSGFATGVETGAKYFPWRIEHHRIRPYIGTALLRTSYQQQNGTEQIRLKYPLTAGIVFNHNNHLIELGGGYIPKHSNPYYINTTTSTTIKKHPLWFSIGYKWMIETTLSAEKNWQSGKTKWLTDTLASLKRLNGLTIGVGFSSTFFLQSSEHNESKIPYIDNHKGALTPDLGIGYYFHKPDLQLNLSYRSMNSKIEAYGFSQVAIRKAISFEAYKFLFDYHGFAAFVGAIASYESLQVKETDQTQIQSTEEYSGIKPGLIFGWDIRPNRIQSWYLRTNLRYFPNLNIEMPDGKKVAFDQLEFNFIQLVVFPGRIL